jgi:fumarate reductase flavoprotein subunit
MKVRTVVVFAALLAVLAGCASTPQAVPIGNATGSAEATAPGFGGDITVSITMADGFITDVKIVGDMETPTIGGLAITRAPGIIKRNNSAAIDSISGASVTTSAISAAAQAAIDKIAK